MNRKIRILLVALVFMDILDGDFIAITALDAIKICLYLICFILTICDNGKDET